MNDLWIGIFGNNIMKMYQLVIFDGQNVIFGTKNIIFLMLQ